MNRIFNFITIAGLSVSTVSGFATSQQQAYSSPVINLSDFERHVFSQNGEDGILEKVFEVLGILNEGHYVEFGVEQENESNTRFFREKYDWKGVSIDNHYQNEAINLYKETITAENINALLEKYDAPEEFDLLSMDLDYNDFHVWQAMDSSYSPKVVIIEYNAVHLPSEDLVVVYDETKGWDGTNYFGGSLLAFSRLAADKGYSLVNTDKNGVNAIFVRNDLLTTTPCIFENVNDVEALYHSANYGCGPRGSHVADPALRPYQDSAGNLVQTLPTWVEDDVEIFIPE